MRRFKVTQGCAFLKLNISLILNSYLSPKTVKCSVDKANRSSNAIFGKIGRLASEEVTLHPTDG